MTERQYVEHIRKTAEAYVASFGAPALNREAWQAWIEVKQRLSAETAIALCDAWLAGEGRTEAKSSEGTDGA